MFNSVAKYFWGGDDQEADGSEVQAQGEGLQVQEEEHVDVPVDEHSTEDDWVLVGKAGKENHRPSIHRQHHHYHHPLNRHHHQQSHHSSHDSLSQQFMEVELLDEASSLLQPLADPSGPFPLLPDCDTKSSSDQEDNGLDSGVRPSSPESVFSACSGRSSATYRPRGADSEAWIVAPPPCFTGSQCESLNPLVSDPLENLLIEHPSMSVYVSQPANLIYSLSNDLPSQALPSVFNFSSGSSPHVALSQETLQNGEADNETSPGEAVASRLDHAVQPRNRAGEAAVHQQGATLEEMQVARNIAQRKALSVAHRSNNRRKCKRQNQVYSSPKALGNHRNKQLKPSGFRCSRVQQRHVPSHV